MRRQTRTTRPFFFSRRLTGGSPNLFASKVCFRCACKRYPARSATARPCIDERHKINERETARADWLHFYAARHPFFASLVARWNPRSPLQKLAAGSRVSTQCLGMVQNRVVAKKNSLAACFSLHAFFFAIFLCRNSCKIVSAMRERLCTKTRLEPVRIAPKNERLLTMDPTQCSLELHSTTHSTLKTFHSRYSFNNIYIRYRHNAALRGRRSLERHHCFRSLQPLKPVPRELALLLP